MLLVYHYALAHWTLLTCRCHNGTSFDGIGARDRPISPSNDLRKFARHGPIVRIRKHLLNDASELGCGRVVRDHFARSETSPSSFHSRGVRLIELSGVDAAGHTRGRDGVSLLLRTGFSIWSTQYACSYRTRRCL